MEEPQVFGVPLAAGTATAEPQADGTVLVRDVPLFAELLPDDPSVKDGMRVARDRAWLERSLQKAQARISKGYKMPMTLRHHFDEPRRVGHFRPTKVVDAEVNPGEAPRATLLGDKIYENRAAFEESKDHDYRSVEISPDDPEELSALALLRDKAPFFRFPSLVERLAPAEREAFVKDAFIARSGVAPQLWRGRTEAFESYEGAKNPYAVVNAMIGKGQVKSEKKAEEVKSAIQRGDHEAMSDKEAPVADGKPDKGSNDYKAKFEAMMQKTFETMMAKCHAALEAAMGGDEAKEATAKAGGTEEPSAKKPDSAESKPEGEKKDDKSRAPDATPAVSQAAAPESFAAKGQQNGNGHAVPEQFAARLATQDQTILGLRGIVEKMQREKEAVQIVANARKTLVDMGAPSVTEAFESAATKAAISGGQAAVDLLVESVKLGMGLAARGPEAYGALGQTGGAPPANPFEGEVKKAVEVFGARPGAKERIYDLAAQFRAEGETFVRSLAPGEFMKTCQGTPQINPSIHEAFGGLKRSV